MFDDFDLEIQCEEYYLEEIDFKKLKEIETSDIIYIQKVKRGKTSKPLT